MVLCLALLCGKHKTVKHIRFTLAFKNYSYLKKQTAGCMNSFTEPFGLEGTIKGHVIPTPYNKQGHLQLSQWV